MWNKRMVEYWKHNMSFITVYYDKQVYKMQQSLRDFPFEELISISNHLLGYTSI